MTLDIQRADADNNAPDDGEFSRWVALALQYAELGEGRSADFAADGISASSINRELTIRLVGEAEMATLNRDYRGKDQPTNVLSFPAQSAEDLPAGLPPELCDELARQLGDMAICGAVVVREAADQGKAEIAHWAHITLHGVLHLLGYDHLEAADAAEMEALEIKLLAKLGYSDPY